MVVALGQKSNDRPYTFPEVERLRNVAELMDNILSHSRLSAQAALQAKMEHLAMLSRGLAHDLKNLITPVSSFLIHTDGKFPPHTPEAEVHAAARHSVRVMTDYVREALFFAERLEPQFEPVDTPKILRAVHELTAARASSHSVVLDTSSGLRSPLVADGVLLQRMLANLVNNAIDASRPGQTVLLRAKDHGPDWVRFEVIDSGSGIPPEHLNRIFEPYFTTKEFGDTERGFGLGLTICEKIALLHGGRISVHSELNRGTTFSVDLPTSPPSPTLPANPIHPTHPPS